MLVESPISPLRGDNLFQNSDLEANALNNWGKIATARDYHVDVWDLTGDNIKLFEKAHDQYGNDWGDAFLALGRNSSISQSVDVSEPSTFELTFDAIGHDRLSDANNQLEVVVDGVVIATVLADGGQSIFIDLPSGSSTIEFVSLSSKTGRGPGIDDIQLRQVLEAEDTDATTGGTDDQIGEDSVEVPNTTPDYETPADATTLDFEQMVNGQIVDDLGNCVSVSVHKNVPTTKTILTEDVWLAEDCITSFIYASALVQTSAAALDNGQYTFFIDASEVRGDITSLDFTGFVGSNLHAGGYQSEKSFNTNFEFVDDPFGGGGGFWEITVGVRSEFSVLNGLFGTQQEVNDEFFNNNNFDFVIHTDDNGMAVQQKVCPAFDYKAVDPDPISPIALDLNHDGKIGVTGATTSMDKDPNAAIGRTVTFDIDNDGKKEVIEWFDGSGDGILVDNRDGNLNASNIDGGRLFGDEGGRYANGYDKLEQLDANGDGLLNGAELNGLEVWIDDGDAVLEAGETKTLAEVGVTQLAVAETVTTVNGQKFIRGEATLDTGETSEMDADAMIQDTNIVGQGTALIISEDGDSGNPEQNALGGVATFEFAVPTSLYDVKVIGADKGGQVDLYDVDGNVVKSIEIAQTGSNTIQVIVLDAQDVDRMEITLDGAGAVDELNFDKLCPYSVRDAVDDVLVVSESETFGDVDGDVLSNDTQGFGDTTTAYAGDVLAVNGLDVNVGQIVAGSGGGQLIVNADGSFDFDANGEFDTLDFGENAETDFTYEIESGETATLRVIVEGENNNAPIAMDDVEEVQPNDGLYDDDGAAVIITASLNALDNDTDPDGDAISITTLGSDTTADGDGWFDWQDGSAGGQIRLNHDGTFQFKDGDKDFEELTEDDPIVQTSIDYQITDTEGATGMAELVFQVEGFECDCPDVDPPYIPIFIG